MKGWASTHQITIRCQDTRETRDAQSSVQSFIRYFPLYHFNFCMVRKVDSRIQFLDPKVVQSVEQNNPHNVVCRITRARRYSLRVAKKKKSASASVDISSNLTETKSHSPSKLLGTPTRFRYSSLHSVSACANVHRLSNGMPSESVAGRQSCLDIWRAVRASE